MSNAIPTPPPVAPVTLWRGACLVDWRLSPGNTEGEVSYLALPAPALAALIEALKFIASHKGMTLLGDGSYSEGVAMGFSEMADAARLALSRIEVGK